ncbi:MAG: NUDIX domain-containing protein [Ruminococcus sp.]|nr:NUDIX domain-containing protein [Ruminococcus sp.]
MEYIDIYDKDKKLTDKTIARGGELSDGEYRLVVHICVFNSNNEMLIQKRQPFKKGWSGKWDVSVGGGVQAGESSVVAAQREVKEEIGVDVDLSNERPFACIIFTNGFDDYYLIEINENESFFITQPEEVEKVMWADKKTILSMIDDGSFIPYHKGFIEMLFDMRKKTGTIVGY